MDRRILKTRQAVVNALTSLMETKEYQKITINDILQKADIGRSTFYENYENKEQVFDEILDNLIYHVFDEIEHHDGHAFQNNFKEEITHMFIHIRDNEGMSKTFLLGKSAEIFCSHMGQRVADICDVKLKSTNKIPQELVHMHISSTFSDVLKYWSSRHFNDTPETMATYFLYLASEAFII